jgi:hypothetical protein
MLDPNMMNQLGKVRQQELIALGQESAKARRAQPRRPRQPMALLLLLSRALGR